MNKTVTKIVCTGILASVLVSTPSYSVQAIPAVELQQQVNQSASSFGPLAPYIVLAGTVVVTGVGAYEALRENSDIYVLQSGLQRLPDTYKPNSVVEKVKKNGRIIQRRYYDENGNAKFDIDLTDHGQPEYHPFSHGGVHKHVYRDGVRDKGEELTEWEYIKYVKVPEGKVGKSEYEQIVVGGKK